MKSNTLVHFVEWKKIPEEKVDSYFRDLVQWGATSIVAHPLWGKLQIQNKKYIRQMAVRLRDAGLVTPACHAFWGPGYDLFCEDESLRRKNMEEHRVFLKELTELQVKTYTIHLGSGPDRDKALACYDSIRRSVDELLPCCEECGIVLAMENGNDSMETLELLADLVKSYDSPYAGICFDTGHAHCYTKDWKNALDLLRPWIATCHMHDNYGSFDDHNPPGEGDLPWKELIRELKNCPVLEHAETESGNYGKESWEEFCKVWTA